MNLMLSNAQQEDRPLFPTYPNPLVSCATSATVCAPPPELLSHMTTEVSAFAPNFQIPVVQQTSLSVEKEIGTRTAVGVNYLYVHGMHLIRARDVNLPPPTPVTYPVYDQSGANLLGYYTVDSFATWDTTRTLTCPFPPCLGDVQRPMPQLGSVNVFESSATSIYHGLTISLRRRMHHGFGVRLAYTWAHAMDDGQDALVVGRPATVQNSYLPEPGMGAEHHRPAAPLRRGVDGGAEAVSSRPPGAALVVERLALRRRSHHRQRQAGERPHRRRRQCRRQLLQRSPAGV